jgi:septum formation topological specificity factor MinE
MYQTLERLRIAAEGRAPGAQHGKLSILRKDLTELLRDYHRLAAQLRHLTRERDDLKAKLLDQLGQPKEEDSHGAQTRNGDR